MQRFPALVRFPRRDRIACGLAPALTVPNRCGVAVSKVQRGRTRMRQCPRSVAESGEYAQLAVGAVRHAAWRVALAFNGRFDDMNTQSCHDVLIIGSGAAGLALALRLPRRLRVALVAKRAMTEGASLYAQGGVSAALDARDSIDAHVTDTVNAGAGLCDEAVARFVAGNARAAIEWLVAADVPFSRYCTDAGADMLHLHREGGHSHRRVVHAADATGRAISTTLEQRVRARPNVEIFEHHVAIDLIRRPDSPHSSVCHGAHVLDADGSVQTFAAHHTVLATGGASRVYHHTSNPDSVTGDGIAMAWRAGCRVANMEFNQFHPTCLFHPSAKPFLLSEALRGEGARLLLPDGKPFMSRFDVRAELAPRDIVARAIDHEMKRVGADCVYLDISHRPADFLRDHFPTINHRCLASGHDFTREPLPVVPAAHYTCGGVVVDRTGRTDLAGLHAIGETSCTGLHGANRLASNSLLECLVYANAAADDIARTLESRGTTRTPSLPVRGERMLPDLDDRPVVGHHGDELRRLMWDCVGIVRTDNRLQRARHGVALLGSGIRDYYDHCRATPDLLELRNLVTVAELIVRCAQSRRESRGLHHSLDYPRADDSRPAVPSVLTPSFAGD